MILCLEVWIFEFLINYFKAISIELIIVYVKEKNGFKYLFCIKQLPL